MRRWISRELKHICLWALNYGVTKKFIHRAVLLAKEKKGHAPILRDSEFKLLGAFANGADQSYSEIFQDLWVLFETGYKRGGFFVEFGATNGIRINNTFLLETAYGWKGILAEPAPIWHAELAKNRACAITHECVWSATGEELTFRQAPDPGYSTLVGFGGGDVHAHAREGSAEVIVKTISLNDLLLRYSAPRTIDYMSVDTEGSELSILQAFDFERYDVRLLTIEHNYTEQEAKLDDLLAAKGYERCFRDYSMYDAWYRKKM
jgi:FkbM family methyltransferase